MQEWSAGEWFDLGSFSLAVLLALALWLANAWRAGREGGSEEGRIEVRMSKAEERIEQTGLRQLKVEAELVTLNEKLFDRLAEMQRESFRLQLESLDRFATKADLQAVEARITRHIESLREGRPRRREGESRAA